MFAIQKGLDVELTAQNIRAIEAGLFMATSVTPHTGMVKSSRVRNRIFCRCFLYFSCGPTWSINISHCVRNILSQGTSFVKTVSQIFMNTVSKAWYSSSGSCRSFQGMGHCKPPSNLTVFIRPDNEIIIHTGTHVGLLLLKLSLGLS